MRCLAALPLLFALTYSSIAAEPISGVVTPQVQFVVTPHHAGVVEQILVKAGEYVEKGDVLARLDDTEQQLMLQEAIAAYRVAEANFKIVKNGSSQVDAKILAAQLAAATAQLQFAQRDFERKERLFRDGAISEAAISEQEYNLKAAKVRVAELQAKQQGIEEHQPAKVTVAEAELQLAKTAIEMAQQRVTQCVLRSPIDGQVLKHDLQVGGLAQPGETSLLMAETDALVVRALLPEARLPSLERGLKCRVQTTVGEIAGRVGQVAPIVENGQISVTIHLDAGETKLLPGMQATVTLEMRDASE